MLAAVRFFLLAFVILAVVPTLAMHRGPRLGWRAVALHCALIGAAFLFWFDPLGYGPLDVALCLVMGSALGTFYAGWRYGLGGLGLAAVYFGAEYVIVSLAAEILFPSSPWFAPVAVVVLGLAGAIGCLAWTLYGVRRQLPRA